MDELIDFIGRFIAFGENVFEVVFERDDVKDEIIRLVTIEQLYEQGIDGTGDLIQPEGYAPFTIELKKLDGQRYDHVTLNDSGDFYDSFKVTVGAGAFTITADGRKSDKNLLEVYGEDILGLTEKSQNELIQYVVEVISEELRDRVLR